MAASVLRHISLNSSASANTWVNATAVPATRALVVGKLTVSWFSGLSGTFTIAIGASATPSTAQYIATAVPLSAGEVYSESGLVIPAGEFVSLLVNVANAGGVCTLNLFGEEVDN